MSTARAFVYLSVVLVSACAASSAEVRNARSTQYQTDFDTVWDRVLNAVRVDYPVVKVLDKENRRLVTCWRPVERSSNAGGIEDSNAINQARGVGEGASNWFFYRAVIEISPSPPFRVAVSGRTAQFAAPQIMPIAHDDINEPGWIEGRTNRLVLQIHDQMKEFATTTNSMTPRASDPDRDENTAETCIIRAAEMGIQGQEMKGIVIGDPGAAPLGEARE